MIVGPLLVLPGEGFISFGQLDQPVAGLFIGHAGGQIPVVVGTLQEFGGIHPLPTRAVAQSGSCTGMLLDQIIDGRRASMPESCDPADYWARAKEWRERAATMPEDHPERAVCLELAEGYERLAALMENRNTFRQPILSGSRRQSQRLSG
jgi:hypothetical protein